MGDRGVAAETWAMTASGPRQMRWLVGRQHVSIVHGQPFTSTPEGVWSSGRGALVRVRTVEGYGVRLAWTQPMQLSDGSWKDAEQLQPSDRLRLQHHDRVLDWSAAPLEGKGDVEAASRAEYRDLVRLLALQATIVEDRLGRAEGAAARGRPRYRCPAADAPSTGNRQCDRLQREHARDSQYVARRAVARARTGPSVGNPTERSSAADWQRWHRLIRRVRVERRARRVRRPVHVFDPRCAGL